MSFPRQDVCIVCSKTIKGVLHANLQNAIPRMQFVCYLKIINTLFFFFFFFFWKNTVCILKQTVQGTQKWH